MVITDSSPISARFAEQVDILEKANGEINLLIRSEDIPKHKLMDALTPAFAKRIEALNELEVLEPQFHALEPNGVEFGYSHESNLDAEGELEPIPSSTTGKRWYGSLNEAVAARANDLRWTLPTFIISRPKPLPGQRLG